MANVATPSIQLGGPVLKYLPSVTFFPIFGPTVVPKTVSF